MKEKQSRFKSFLYKIVFWLVAPILVIGVLVGLFFYNNKTEGLSRDIMAKLSVSSELTTAKLNYSGYRVYEDEGISFFTKANFLMVYDATVRAGIDVNEVKVEVENDKRIIWITIPSAKIQEVKVDPNSIKYFDEKFTLFNFNEKEDANKALAEAELVAEKKAASFGILELADKQSEALIKGIIEDIIPKDYVIKVRDNNTN